MQNFTKCHHSCGRIHSSSFWNSFSISHVSQDSFSATTNSKLVLFILLAWINLWSILEIWYDTSKSFILPHQKDALISYRNMQFSVTLNSFKGMLSSSPLSGKHKMYIHSLSTANHIAAAAAAQSRTSCRCKSRASCNLHIKHQNGGKLISVTRGFVWGFQPSYRPLFSIPVSQEQKSEATDRCWR